MREYLPFLVIGLASGSIYAIAAMGLVVTYKPSGAPVATLTAPGNVLVVVPEPADTILFSEDGRAWKQLASRHESASGAESAALFVATRNVSVETVACGRKEEDNNGGEALPFQWHPALDTLTIIDRQRDKQRNHQDPDDGDLVCGSHSGKE